MPDVDRPDGFVADAEHQGTAESAWLPVLSGLPALCVPDASTVVVVAPHPDDEVLAVGGLLRHLHHRGNDVVVVAVTNGERSHPEQAPGTVGATRTREAADAYLALGIAPLRHRCRLPDGAVTDHEGDLATLLADVVGNDDLVIAPWAHDGHPDHDAAGRAAALVASEAGATLLAYPVWAWHWGRPGSEDVPLGRASLHPLNDADRRAKAEALAAFASQLTPRSGPSADPVLGPSVLARFRRPFEVLLHP